MNLLFGIFFHLENRGKLHGMALKIALTANHLLEYWISQKNKLTRWCCSPRKTRAAGTAYTPLRSVPAAPNHGVETVEKLQKLATF